MCQATDPALPVGVFFANSTAYLQHRFWRHMASSDFEFKPDAQQLESYSGAIRFGYETMDAMVGQVLDDDRLKQSSIAFVTALSQHANPDRQSTPPHEAYRPDSFDRFLSWAGVEELDSVEPLMTHLAWATFESVPAAELAIDALLNVRLGGQAAIDVELHGSRVKFWCSVISPPEPDASIENKDGDSALFSDMFLQVGSSILDGSHHPEGIFWLYDPSHEHEDPTNPPLPMPLEDAAGLLIEVV